MDERTNEQVNEYADVRMNTWMGRWMDGWKEEGIIGKGGEWLGGDRAGEVWHRRRAGRMSLLPYSHAEATP